MRLTASRIMFAPWPVFQSLHAGQSTLASESSWASLAGRLSMGLCVSSNFNASSWALVISLNAARPASFFPARMRSISFSSGSSWSNNRAASKPRDALASPVAQMSTRR